MKRKYTWNQLVDVVKKYDNRAEKFTQEQLEDVLNNAFAEITAIVQAFQDQEVIHLADFYETGELKFTVDIEEDVTSVYDLYLTSENQDATVYQHGIKEIRNKNAVYEDNRYSGRVHVDLSMIEGNEIADNLIIKYYYIPTASSNDIYMDGQVYLALTYAIGTALYDKVNDVARSEQKRAGLNRTAQAIIPILPLDAVAPGKPSIFPAGV